jgi:hypothetical protein
MTGVARLEPFQAIFFVKSDSNLNLNLNQVQVWKKMCSVQAELALKHTEKRSTETQRIRAATKFVGPSGGHSESAFCSSVTKAAQLIFLQPQRIALTITTETLCLSITTEKTHGSPMTHMVLSAVFHRTFRNVRVLNFMDEFCLL